MSSYGVLVNNEFNPINEKIYELMNVYFNDPVMTKVDDKFNGKSVFISQLKSLLVKDKRYLIVHVANTHLQIGDRCNLSDLEWTILQTKETDQILANNCKTFSYNIRDNYKMVELNFPINIDERKDGYSTYKTKMFDNLNFILLKKKDAFENHPETGSLLTFLETFNSIIEVVK